MECQLCHQPITQCEDSECKAFGRRCYGYVHIKYDRPTTTADGSTIQTQFGIHTCQMGFAYPAKDGFQGFTVKATPKPTGPGPSRAKSISSPKPCANCGTTHTNRNAFCSDHCRELTAFIRTTRRWLRDKGKYADRGYDDVFAVCLGKIIGYVTDPNATWNHNIPIKIRHAVIERDKGICQQCGKPGEEIDHIDGPESIMENLQLLCHDCNMGKALACLYPVTDVEQIKLIEAFVASDLAPRINSSTPLQSSDDEQNWARLWTKWPSIPKVEYNEITPLGTFKDVRKAAKRGRL